MLEPSLKKGLLKPFSRDLQSSAVRRCIDEQVRTKFYSLSRTQFVRIEPVHLEKGVEEPLSMPRKVYPWSAELSTILHPLVAFAPFVFLEVFQEEYTKICVKSGNVEIVGSNLFDQIKDDRGAIFIILDYCFAFLAVNTTFEIVEPSAKAKLLARMDNGAQFRVTTVFWNQDEVSLESQRLFAPKGEAI